MSPPSPFRNGHFTAAATPFIFMTCMLVVAISENLCRASLCPLDTTMFPARNGRQKKARSIISYVTRGENDLIFFSLFRCSAYVGKRRRKWLRRTIRATCFRTRILKFRTAGILLSIWEIQNIISKILFYPFSSRAAGRPSAASSPRCS